uniref:Biopterin-dependent aromatic amino acid hydroxylase family profile domain-containing protein n=1 Tax=Parascaris univalens TaxID=6257 RepID=A0A915A0Q0_PARUN
LLSSTTAQGYQRRNGDVGRCAHQDEGVVQHCLDLYEFECCVNFFSLVAFSTALIKKISSTTLTIEEMHSDRSL